MIDSTTIDLLQISVLHNAIRILSSEEPIFRMGPRNGNAKLRSSTIELACMHCCNNINLAHSFFEPLEELGECTVLNVSCDLDLFYLPLALHHL